MSVILVLLPAVYLAPLAVGAAAAAVKAIESRSQKSSSVRVETRMKNKDLVAEAISNLGYEVTLREDSIVGASEKATLMMSLNAEGLWQCHFSGEQTVDGATETLQNLDREYGKLVQRELLRRLENRLPQTNMQKVAEVTNPDMSVTVTLEVQA